MVSPCRVGSLDRQAGSKDVEDQMVAELGRAGAVATSCRLAVQCEVEAVNGLFENPEEAVSVKSPVSLKGRLRDR